MKRVIIIVVLLFLIVPFLTKAQGPAYKIYTTAEGLPSNNIYYTLQDSDGFIWFATDNGVSRFDGKHFHNFSTADGLTDLDVIKIVEDSKKRLWFLTFNGNLSFYQNGKIHNSSNDSMLRRITIHSTIHYIFEDSKKNIWISYIEYKTVRISPSGSITLFNHVYGRYIWEDKKKQVNIIAGGALYTFNGNSFTEKKFTGFIPKQGILLPGDSTVLLLGGKEFKGTKDGIIKTFIGIYNIRSNKLNIDSSTNYSSPFLESLSIDNFNNIWLSSLKGALKISIANVLNPRLLHYDFFNGRSISNVYQDKSNNYWFTSFDAGVFMVPSLSTRLFDISSGLVENNITSMVLMPDSSVVLGSKNGSIQLIKKDSIKNKNQSLLAPTGVIKKLAKDSHGNLWILTDVSLLKYNNKTFQSIPDKSTFYKTLFIDNTDTVWIGVGNGIRKITNNKVSVVSAGPINRVYSIIEKGHHQLWLGTDKGLFTYDGKQMAPAWYQNILLSKKINALASSSDLTLWVATAENGLLQVKSNGNVYHYSIENGLLSNNCNSLLIDGNKIYLSTNKGLNIITNNNDKINIATYSSENGLVSDYINEVIKKNEHTLLLATNKGIIEFDDRTPVISGTSKPYINEIRVNDNKRELPILSNLQYNENNLQIDFGIINFNAGESNTLFCYKLKGIDTGWNYTTATSVKYNHLPPGSYAFTVKPGSNNSKANQTTASFAFFIETPLWQTWWFRLAVILCIILLVALIIKGRVNAYVKQINQKKNAAESELRALRAQINPHFIFNSLNSIQDFILQNQAEDANLYLSKFATLMRNILSHSRASEIVLSEEIDSLQVYLELESLVRNNRFSFEFHVDNLINAEEIQIPSMILQPYIENAIIHGLATIPKDGRLTILFQKNDTHLLCTIKDNGIGRKRAGELKQQKVWKNRPSLGMQVTQERIDLLNTYSKNKITLEVIDLTDNNGKAEGTCVNIGFPLLIYLTILVALSKTKAAFIAYMVCSS